MTGYKVIVVEYSGKRRGDNVVYSDHHAAIYQQRCEETAARAHARSDDAPEIFLETVKYEPMPNGECRVGRVIHDLRKDTREELVREDALCKLNPEERKVLGLCDPTSNPTSNSP